MISQRRLLTVSLGLVLLMTLGMSPRRSAAAQAAPSAGIARPAGTTIPYSGSLTDASGQPVADGRYDFIFELFDSPSGGSLQWSETQLGMAVKAGHFAVSFGSHTPLPAEVFEANQLWLAVSVRAADEAGFTSLAPRQALDQKAAGPLADSPLACPHSHFTDYWGGTSATYGLEVDNYGTGDGIRAYSSSTSNNYAAVWAVNNALTGSGTALFGSSTRGLGVYAFSSLGDALEATTETTTKSAVYAHTTGGYGLTARSTNNFAVLAGGGGDGSYADPIGDVLLEGSRGELFANGNILELFSNGFIVFDLDNDNNGVHQLEVWNGAEVLVFKVDESGNTVATGTKSASVATASYGERLLYAVESPEVWLEDFGTAQLIAGSATVEFEPVFAETISLKTDYHVYVTPLCDEAVLLFVTAKTAQGFTVQGVSLNSQPSSCALDYRVVAKRLGYESARLPLNDLSHTSLSSEAQP